MFLLACGKKSGGPINFDMIKTQLNLDEEQSKKIDANTENFMISMKENYYQNSGNKEKLTATRIQLSDELDNKLKQILSKQQFEIYQTEIAIERKGREAHNMELIKQELNLDSTQRIEYDQANAIFKKTLIDNHDNYHGKPDVYQQYYHELDKSRVAVFKKIMTKEQYTKYLQLADKYNLGKSEH